MPTFKATLLATVGIGTAFAAVLPMSSSAAPEFAMPLPVARSIQVHELIRTADKSGELKPAYDIQLRIARPDQVNALITAVSLKKTHQYVANGKAEQEYNAKENTVRKLTIPKSGRSYSNYRSMAQIDLILNNGQLAAPKADVQRTTTTETVNNTPMTVITDTLPPQISRLDGATFITANKLWVTAKTGLPYRYSSAYTTKGKTTTTEEITFSDWRFDKPLTVAQLAFAPPADAKPYVEPKFEMTSLAVGTIAPDFAAVTPEGKTVHLSDYKGKVVVLDFWATWCHPCQDAMPHLESVYKQVKGQDVAVLGLCVWDSKAAYDKWVVDKARVYTFPTAFDPEANGPKSIASSLYKMNAIPTQYVIGKDGKVAAVQVGDEEHWLEKALVAQGVTVSSVVKEAMANH